MNYDETVFVNPDKLGLDEGDTLDELYRKLGKAYYEGAFEDPLPQLLPLFDKITKIKGLSAGRGQQKRDDVPAQRYCPSCGKLIDGQDRFCGGCGYDLNDVGGQKPPTLMPTDCPCYALPLILPNIRISWDYHPTFMLISGWVLRSFTHL